MKLFRLFWNIHKWTGIFAAVFFLVICITGALLLLKKNFDYLQPPTQRGAEGELADFLPIQDVLAAAFESGHPDFRSIDDVDRIDVRPGKRVHKVRSKHNYAEIQVDAITGEILSIDVRRSDLIEHIHDGSIVGDWFKVWFMPLVALSLLGLVVTGLWIWIHPIIRRKRRKGQTHPALGARNPEARPKV
jgi:uncharacterized iron-regulated membrane protein